jgi:hypothetical protein
MTPNLCAAARPRPPLVGRQMIALLSALLLLAAIALSAGHASPASAQSAFNIPITYANYGLGYGNYGLGYGNYGLGYGNYGLGYGLGYNNYLYGSNYGYPSLTNYLTSGTYNYGTTYATSQSYASSTPNVPLAVGAAWTFCTGPNGPVWIHPGQSTIGLIC